MKVTSIDRSRLPVAPIENIPAWANFQAVEEDGGVYWYECRPEEGKRAFIYAPGDLGLHFELVCSINPPANWRETLIDLRPLREAAAAKARMAAAAPDLLAALKSIANGPWPDWVDSPEAQCRFDDQIARAAIAKAEGESNDYKARAETAQAIVDELLAALKAAVACGIFPASSALDGGASKYSEQVQVADQIRAAIAKATRDQS